MRNDAKHVKCLLTALVVCMGIGFAPAQKTEYLNLNNVNAGISIGGNLFTIEDSLSYDGKFESPKGSGVTSIFTQALWITALDANDSLYCAANRYWDYGADFFDGPVANTYDSVYDNYYKRVWKVTQAQITQFRSLSFPTTANLVDAAILHWPAKGNPSVLNDYGVHINTRMAPFVDVNGNGVYEPLLGDYPAICADEAIFFVYNDARAAHTQTAGKPLGIEVRGLASVYTDLTSNIPYAKRAVNNTVFVQYEIENKSANNYTSFDVANWVDGDLGCFNNDRVGCDTIQSLMFAYNGEVNDYSCAPEKGYGTLPVALGVKTLNQHMNVFGYLTGQGSSSPGPADPLTPVQYRNLSEGFWNDFIPFTFGGPGYGGVDTTKFIFPGNLTDTSQWSELQANMVPGDRKMFASTYHLGLNAGEIKHYDYAFFTSFDTTSNYIAIVDTLKRDAATVQSFYDNQITPCQSQLALGINAVPQVNQLNVSLYPNPAHSQVFIECSTDMQTVELLDVAGRVLLTKTVGARTTMLPVNTLAKGVYLVNVLGNGSSVIKKMVVE